MARRPHKVKIGDNEYKVVSRKYKSWSKKKTRTFGQIGYNKNVIEINKDQKNGIWNGQSVEEVDTVIHEILHGVVSEYEINVDGRKEEKWVTLMANGLTDVLLKNPNLVAWLKERIDKESAA